MRAPFRPLRRLTAALLLRRLSRDLASIGQALDRQNVLLGRLAEAFAPPAPPPTDAARVARESGWTAFDPAHAALADDYIERTHRATGHTPSDEEVLQYLADESTHDLAERLTTREAELARLTEGAR